MFELFGQYQLPSVGVRTADPLCDPWEVARDAETATGRQAVAAFANTGCVANTVSTATNTGQAGPRSLHEKEKMERSERLWGRQT